MKHLRAVAIAALTASLAGAGAVPAKAALIDTSFTGEVVSQTGTSFSINQSISGSFVYNTAKSAFVSFTIGGASIATGFSSSAKTTPGLTDAIYEAQISPVATGGSVNETFSLDLSSLTAWPSSNAIALLSNTTQLTTNLDTIGNPLSAFPSTFGYYIATASGTGVTAVTADLTSISTGPAAAVPEPNALALLVGGVLSLGLLRRRR
jgi:hypothetical protein